MLAPRQQEMTQNRMNDIRNCGRLILVAAFIGIVCLLAYPVIAAPLAGDNDIDEQSHSANRGTMSDLVDHLEGLGFNLSSVREALTLGDMETAHELLDVFFQKYQNARAVLADSEMTGDGSDVPDIFQGGYTKPAGGRGVRMLTLIEEVEEYGYDMTYIRSEIATGDLDTAGTLMRRFLEDHGDELPLSTIGKYSTCIPGIPGYPEQQDDNETDGLSTTWNEGR